MKNALKILAGYYYTLFVVVITILLTSTASAQKTEPSWFSTTLADSALTLTKQHVIYDGRYVKLDYPGGDVAPDRGVCTDVIIRAYRLMDIDLQAKVHSDMLVNFDKYPNHWGKTRADYNIDHRRVPNLMVWFSEFGTTKEITRNGKDYIPGDIVCWNLGGFTHHIGIVSRILSADKQRYLIIHNIGAGQVLEDCLFSFKIIGHYTYRYKYR
tara:strand:+ start:184 stop:819 length:636 start_codon:yes stop_codon:yes gene_type:complete